jgi:hypothetical protein
MNTPIQDLEQQLRTHYHQEFGEPLPSSALWHHLADRLPAHEQPLAWWQRWLQAFSSPKFPLPSAPRPIPVRGIVVVCSLLVGVLLLASGVVYTVGPFKSHQSHRASSPFVSSANVDALLSQLLLSDTRPSTQQVARNGLFTEINLTQSVNAGMVKLQKVYADANNIMLGFTFTGSLSLQDATGVTRQLIIVANHQTLKPSFAEFKLAKGQHQIAVLAYFNTAPVQSDIQQLRLNISITTARTTAHFDLTVPFLAGKTVQVHQTITSHGRTIMLDRVIITPTEARFYYTSQGVTFPLIQILSIAGKTYRASVGYVASGVEDYSRFWYNLQNEAGTWTLKASAPLALGIESTWQFTFTIP